LLVWLAYRASPEQLQWMGALALLPAIGFTFIYLTGARQTGLEVSGGRIWWNHLRPIHAALYATFAALAWKKHPRAWMVLLADVIFGLTSFLVHYYG
jgi:hypothetical protein